MFLSSPLCTIVVFNRMKFFSVYMLTAKLPLISKTSFAFFNIYIEEYMTFFGNMGQSVANSLRESFFLRRQRFPSFASIAVVLFFFGGIEFVMGAPSPDVAKYDSVMTLWHNAELSLSEQKFQDAANWFHRTIEASSHLDDYDEREWYNGNAAYGLARSHAAMGDTLAARIWLGQALGHHFWQFNIVHSDSAIVRVCGEERIDSLCAFWGREQKWEAPQWNRVFPKVIFPRGYTRKHSYPLIVALHGGNDNYAEFAYHWTSIADEANAVIIVPPGIDRFSPISFAWEFDIARIDSAIIPLIDKTIHEENIDRARIYIAGYSQGGNAALNLALRHPDIVCGALVIAGFNYSTLDNADLKRAKQSGTRIYTISGEYDYQPFVQSLENSKKVCDEFGIPFHFELADGMTHEMPLNFADVFRSAWHWLNDKNSFVSKQQRIKKYTNTLSRRTVNSALLQP